MLWAAILEALGCKHCDGSMSKTTGTLFKLCYGCKGIWGRNWFARKGVKFWKVTVCLWYRSIGVVSLVWDPSIAHPNIVNYLVLLPSPHTTEDLKSYISLEAYKWCVDGWGRFCEWQSKSCCNVFNQPNLNCTISSQYPGCSQEPLPLVFHLPDKKRAERIRMSRFLSRISWFTFVNHKRFFSSDNIWHHSSGFVKKNWQSVRPFFRLCPIGAAKNTAIIHHFSWKPLGSPSACALFTSLRISNMVTARVVRRW